MTLFVKSVSTINLIRRLSFALSGRHSLHRCVTSQIYESCTGSDRRRRSNLQRTVLGHGTGDVSRSCTGDVARSCTGDVARFCTGKFVLSSQSHPWYSRQSCFNSHSSHHVHPTATLSEQFQHPPPSLHISPRSSNSSPLHTSHRSNCTLHIRSLHTPRTPQLPNPQHPRSLHTTPRTPRTIKPTTGFRPSTDHRGNITVGNRPDTDFVDEEEGVSLDDRDYSEMMHNATGLNAGVVGSTTLQGNMMVILPWIKWGPNQKKATTDQLLLDEACALAASLQNVTVVEKEIIKIRYEAKDTVFGTGQVLALRDKMRTVPNLACVFVSIDVLSINQIRALEAEFGVRVVDRYWVVLAIFHQHARTAEARMQVALAELPYIRSRFKHDAERAMLNERIKRLQLELKKLQRHRQQIRNKRKNTDYPTVAVVGYTNTGKTSLISALSGDTELEGRDQLFATLDVTSHNTQLACGLSIALLDTIGFIQDLPTTLVASFNATLQDAANASVIIHVRDLSHPDRLMQHTTVMAALHSIDLPYTTPIITLDNKADLLLEQEDSDEQENFQIVPASTTTCDIRQCVSYMSEDVLVHAQREGDPDGLSNNIKTSDDTDEDRETRLQALKKQYIATPSMIVSAKTKQGLATVMEALEDQVLQVTGRRMYRMKLPTGGEHIRLLRTLLGGIGETTCPDDANSSVVTCAMTQRQLGMFKKTCQDLKKYQP